MKNLKLKPLLFVMAFAGLFTHNWYLQTRIEVAIGYAEGAEYEANRAYEDASDAADFARVAADFARDAAEYAENAEVEAQEASQYAEEARNYSFGYNCNYCP